MFYVGDRVKLVGYQNGITLMMKNLGRIYTITGIYDTKYAGKPAYLLDDGYRFIYREDWLEHVEQETINTDELENMLGE